MCDEYDDERMRIFWRMLAEREDLEHLDMVESTREAAVPMPLASEPVPKPKSRPLLR